MVASCFTIGAKPMSYKPASDAATDEHIAPNAKPPHHAHLLEGYDTEAECARGINKSPRTLQRWHRLGIGPPRTLIGKTVAYRRNGVRDWLLAQEQAVGE